MRKGFVLAAWIVAGLGGARLSAAPQSGPELDSSARRALYRPILGTGLRDPSLSSPASAPAVDVHFTTESKNKKAKAMVGLRIGDDLFFDVKFTAPLSESDSEVEPIDLDGLSKSSVADIGFHYLAWRPRLNVEAAAEILEEYTRRHPGGAGGEKAAAGPVRLGMLKDDPDLMSRFQEAVEWGSAWLAAVRFKAGLRGYTYAGRDLRELSTQKMNRSFEAAAGVLLSGLGYFGASLEYQVYFDEASATELILPYGEGSVLQVKTLVLSPPSRCEMFKIRVEYRRAAGAHVAFNPRVSYSPRERIVLAELPVYLFKNADSGLNGGVTASWRSRGNQRFGLGLFIGTSFSILPE